MLRASSSVFSFFVGLVDDIDTIIVISYASLSLSLSFSLSLLFVHLLLPHLSGDSNRRERELARRGHGRREECSNQEKKRKGFLCEKSFFRFSSFFDLFSFSLLSSLSF